jgi:hypothetical protein
VARLSEISTTSTEEVSNMQACSWYNFT